jgi:hypothetical protein
LKQGNSPTTLLRIINIQRFAATVSGRDWFGPAVRFNIITAINPASAEFEMYISLFLPSTHCFGIILFITACANSYAYVT